jgi:hypothetical protein
MIKQQFSVFRLNNVRLQASCVIFQCSYAIEPNGKRGVPKLLTGVSIAFEEEVHQIFAKASGKGNWLTAASNSERFVQMPQHDSIGAQTSDTALQHSQR